ARSQLGLLAARRQLARVAARRERVAELAERRRELRRDDEDLVGVALRELGQHLEVLVLEELGVRVALVDGLEHGPDRLGLALCTQDHGLPRSLGLEDRGLLLALSGKD